MKQKLKTEIEKLEKETSEWKGGNHHYFSRDSPKNCVLDTKSMGRFLCKNCSTGLRIREVMLEAKKTHLADLERIERLVEKEKWKLNETEKLNQLASSLMRHSGGANEVAKNHNESLDKLKKQIGEEDWNDERKR